MFLSKTSRSRLLTVLMTLPLLLSAATMAASTDLSDNPLSSATTAEVKPNILFVLDDSGSMNWRFMPDALSSRENRIGFRNAQCNLVYYNPNSRYVTPKTSTGGDINSGSPTTFTAAYDDGYGAYYGIETRTSADSGSTWTAWTAAGSCTEDTGNPSLRQCRYGALLGSAGSTTDLTTSFRAFVNGTIDSNSATSKIDTAQPAYYWKYLGTTTLVPLAGDCEKLIGTTYTVNGAVYAGGVVTFKTSIAHTFTVGQTVGVADIRPSGYQGIYVVTSVPDTTHFTAALASNPGGYSNSGTAWNATEFATINEYCTDNTTTTSTCAALGKTALWRKMLITSTSGPATADINGDGVTNASDGDERQNFANWYSYYSNRLKMMKAAAGRAFVGMTDSKRIGFLTINPNSPVTSEKFIPVTAYDPTQKANWFSLLYSQTTNGSTPLRTALSRAGRYFANKTDGINDGMADDPVEYSCQQNFSILTTDGYWNGTGGLKLDGSTAMDNQDGVISELDAYRPTGSKYTMSPRPIFDGASTTYTWNTATRTYQRVACQLQEKKTQQVQTSTGGVWQQQTSQLQKKSGQVQFTTNLQKKTGQLQYSSNIVRNTGQLQVTTNKQRQVGQLQYQSKIQSKTGQLQFSTNQQSKTGQLQYQSKIQSKTGQLQFATNQQSKTGQLQYQSKIQSKTGQLQFSTNQQRMTGQLQRSTFNIFTGWSAFANVSTCNEDANTQCRINSVTWNYVTTYPGTCTPTRTGSAGSYAWTGNAAAVDCQTAGSFNATWTTAAVCNEGAITQCRVGTGSFVKVQSCTPSRTGSAGSYAWTGGASAVDCNTLGALDGTWTSVSTCNESSNVACQIGTGSFTYITTYPGTCTPTRTGSAGSYAWTGNAAAVDCQTSGSFNATWTTAAVCNEGAITQCRINASFIKAQSCTPTRTGSAGSYAWTGGASAVDCNTLGALDGTWTNVSTCNESSNVACQIGTGSFAYVTVYPGTCTPTRTGSAGSYAWTGNAAAVDCQTAGSFNGTWANNSVCNEGAITQCRINASFVKAQSCTPTRTGSAGSYAWTGNASAIDCNNTGAFDGVWTNIATCNESSNIACQINAAFVYDTSFPLPTCTQTRSGSAGSYAYTGGAAATVCQTAGSFNPTWTNSSSCTEGANVQCQVASGTQAMVQTCAESHTGSAGSYAWTGNAAAVSCLSTGTVGASWASATTCTESAGVMACRQDPAAAWAYVANPPTCAATKSGVAGSYAWTGGATSVDCQTVGFNPTWTNSSTCTQNVNTQCQINASPLGVPADQCLSQTRSGSAGSYSYTGNAAANECDTVITSPYATVPYACTTAATDNSGFSTQCQFVGGGAFANAPLCTEDATTQCRTTDVTGWVVADICVAAVTPNATGEITQCRTPGTSGSKLQSYARTTATTYSGPGQTGVILTPAASTNGPLSDVLAGACYAVAPAIPGVETVTGEGPPAPPDSCTSGVQEWPCETYSSGSTGLSSPISSALFTEAGADEVVDPATASFTTSAAHSFLVGHSVTISGVSPVGFRGNYQIIEVVDNLHFKVLMPTPPCTPVAPATTCPSTATGTATLFAGSSNSLSDVAQYYYKTDLRNSALGNCTGVLGSSVCEDNVPSTGSGVEDDRANWQHMTTFTMGLGLTGTVTYSANYRTDQCVAKSIADISWAANFATVTTSAAHGFYVSEAVTIAGGSSAGFRGQYRVYDIPSATTFRYALATNPGGAFGTGTATGCADYNRIRTGTMNWPVPVADSPTALDDLWHAAVNGRGQYFSAGDPDSVVSSLASALAGINARVAAAAAAATSNLEPVAGDNFAYTAKYKTQAWTGDLEAREINLTTGAVSGTVIWSAQAKLDDKTRSACDNRSIKLFRSGATNNLVDFTWNSYACDGSGIPTGSALDDLSTSEKANFDSTKVALLSHYSNMGDGSGITVNQRAPAADFNMVNFLRGQRGKEGFSSALPMTNTDINKLYRTREHVLGDIINAQPVFVRGPFADYDDTGYANFKALNAARTPIVYSAANDGMLHAFYAGSSIVDTTGGVESWAFIPTMVLPNLYSLASENYATQHSYSVDGTPSVGDVYDDHSIDPVTLAPVPATWKTILVSGLNKGGKGYYALDITDPATPRALWEFKHDAGNCVTVNATTKAPAADQYSDCHIGYSFSNPVISKLRDGRWVVFVTSGYNNVNSPSATGDGVGYLYVLDAMNGKILYKIGTGVGDATTPSGLNHISAWVNNSLRNNMTERVYGVDLKGNVWRFDVNDTLNAAGREATRVATAVDAAGVGQPITTRPELATVQGDAFIYVGTGRYLGTDDLGDTQQQSIWGFRDTLSATALTSVRSNLRKMVITNSGSGTSAFRTNGCTAGCASADGWYADLPDSGERVNIDMKLQLGTLVVASNVPETNACNIGGYAWLNYFNNSTGEAVANSADHAVGRRLVGTGGQESLAVGLNIVRLPSGKTVVIATTSAAQQLTVEAPFDVPPPTGKRVSWREIVQ